MSGERATSARPGPDTRLLHRVCVAPRGSVPRNERFRSQQGYGHRHQRGLGPAQACFGLGARCHGYRRRRHRPPVDVLRRDGSVVARFDSAEKAAAWRAAMRRACRIAGIRIHTGLANEDARTAWVSDVDHVVPRPKSGQLTGSSAPCTTPPNRAFPSTNSSARNSVKRSASSETTPSCLHRLPDTTDYSTSQGKPTTRRRLQIHVS